MPRKREAVLAIASTALSQPRAAATAGCRLIDLTVEELVELLDARLLLALGQLRTDDADSLLDTWGAAALLGIAPKFEPGPAPARGSSAWRNWRDTSQAVRDDIAHRFQQLLMRRPELAALARYEGRRRYFVRADLLRYREMKTRRGSSERYAESTHAH